MHDLHGPPFLCGTGALRKAAFADGPGGQGHAAQLTFYIEERSLLQQLVCSVRTFRGRFQPRPGSWPASSDSASTAPKAGGTWPSVSSSQMESQSPGGLGKGTGT